MYRVLYRKYRPRYFADVIGQPQVTDTLKNELRNDRIAHAYLFTGSRGTGKTTCSKILAKAVNCLSPENGDPCGRCEICRGIDDGSVLDVVEIDAASNNGVDDIRTLREEAAFTPANAKYRVYIIDEVHMLSIGAFNALLKTLEEPPEHVVFILATTEVHKLPATILSRCQRFDFHRISPKDIADRLKYVCQCENTEIDDNAALLLAGIADGAMRDALSLLDQCMGKGDRITETIVRQTAGLADKSHLIAITDAIIKKDSAAAVEIVDQLYSQSKEMLRLCDELTAHFRELMLIKSVKKPRDIIVMSDEDYSKANDQALALPMREVVAVIDSLQRAAEKMTRGANRRIEMEMTLVHLCTSVSPGSIDPAIEGRVAALERAVSALKRTPASVNTQTSNAPAPPVMVNKPSADKMEELRKNAVPFKEWPEVIEEIRKTSKTIAAGFDGSRAFLSGKYLLIDSQREICYELLRKSSQRDSVRNAVKMITGNDYKLGRYSYPDEVKSDDALTGLITDLKAAGVSVDEKR